MSVAGEKRAARGGGYNSYGWGVGGRSWQRRQRRMKGGRALGPQADVSEGGVIKSVLNAASQGRGGPSNGHGTWQDGGCNDLELSGFRGGEVTVAAWGRPRWEWLVRKCRQRAATPRGCQACRGYEGSCHSTAGSQRAWSGTDCVPTLGPRVRDILWQLRVWLERRHGSHYPHRGTEEGKWDVGRQRYGARRNHD